MESNQNVPSDPRDVIRRETSITANRYRTINGRTLSEEFHSCSPNTQQLVKGMTDNKTPTSNFYGRNSIVEEEAALNNTNKKYIESTRQERDIMAQYGLVSMNFHNTNKNL
jgi:hypothetical protein